MAVGCASNRPGQGPRPAGLPAPPGGLARREPEGAAGENGCQATPGGPGASGRAGCRRAPAASSGTGPAGPVGRNGSHLPADARPRPHKALPLTPVMAGQRFSRGGRARVPRQRDLLVEARDARCRGRRVTNIPGSLAVSLAVSAGEVTFRVACRSKQATPPRAARVASHGRNPSYMRSVCRGAVPCVGRVSHPGWASCVRRGSAPRPGGAARMRRQSGYRDGRP